MQKIYSIGVREALEKLSYPSFFDRNERKGAFELIMLWGDGEERDAAEKAKAKFPFDEPEETLFPSLYENYIPLPGMARDA